MVGKRDAHTAVEASDARKTCFVMMPISDADGYRPGHFSEVYSQLIEPAVSAAGYDCRLATSTGAAHMIQLEVVTQIATADLCICDLSTNNPNVMFEYGLRQAFDRPTVLIKDDKTRRIFDLSGFRDIEYDHTLRIGDTLLKRQEITNAIYDTVKGADDGSQIFSLVTLMKITKAALPTGEISQDDARFKLLENKIDTIATLLAKQNPRNIRSEHELPSPVGSPRRVRVDRYEFVIDLDSVTIRDMATNMLERFTDGPSLTRSEMWQNLTRLQQQAVLEQINRYSPSFMPF